MQHSVDLLPLAPMHMVPNHCQVCAVSLDCVSGAIYKAGLDPPPQVITLGAHTLDGIITEIQAVADALGQSEKGAEVTGALRSRVEKARSLAAELGEAKHKKVCACIFYFVCVARWIPVWDVAGAVHTKQNLAWCTSLLLCIARL